MSGWIDLKVRKPTEADKDKNGNVLVQTGNGSRTVMKICEMNNQDVAWMSIPEFVPVPDPPDGYEILTDYDAELHPNAKQLDRGVRCWRNHWTRLRYIKSEIYAVPIAPLKPPEGFRIVDTATEPFDAMAHFYCVKDGNWKRTLQRGHYAVNWIYAVPIKPPEPQYRPFASKEEFRPYRDRWWRFKIDPDDVDRPPGICTDSTCVAGTWKNAFEKAVFDDGTPFGIKID